MNESHNLGKIDMATENTYTETAKKPKKSPSQHKKGQANFIDAYVGQKLRERRLILGLSQQDIAGKVNVTFQQLQKYESGANRVSAGRLHELSTILNVPVSYFFDGYISPKPSKEAAKAPSAIDSPDVLKSRETLDLLHLYYKIEDKNLRAQLLAFTKQLASQLKQQK